MTYPLEPSLDEMATMASATVDLLAEFVGGLPDAPAADLDRDDRGDLVTAALRPPPEEPGSLGPLLRSFRDAARLAVETAGPAYMAYVPGGGLVTAALAELLAQTVNCYTGLASFAPALVAQEESVLGWMGREFGLPAATAAGVVTTGGSLATLTALVAARHDRLGDRAAGGTLYVTAHTHRCVAKAARIAGLAADQVRMVPTTADLRMDPEAASRMIAADRRTGRRPFLLVGTAGTTSTGSVDPLVALAELARREGLWFHVDGAYGGFFQLTERGRARLAGIEQADSIVLDPHKGMFLPYGTGVTLVRDRRTLRAAYAAEGPYVQDVKDDGDGDGDGAAGARGGEVALPNYADLGLELSREFRGLRLWLPLHLHGVGAFRAALDEKLDLAAEAYRVLRDEPDLELWEPDLSTVVFRLRHRPGWSDSDADQANEALLTRINATRRVHLSSTRVDGRHTLRICILSHRTHRPHLAAALDTIRSAVRGAIGDRAS